MNIPTYSANLNVASDRCSYFQDSTSTSSESATSCQAFFREVVEAMNIQCAMRTYETTKYNFQQPTVLFNNPFADPGFDKRSIVIVDSHTKEDQPLDLPVRIKSQNNHPPRYIPDNERFSIKSILGLGQSTSRSPSAVDIHYHPCEIFNPLPNNHNGESLTTSHDKICTRSEKQKAYAKTEKRKAYLRAYQ
ncbi:hypothetical protein, partial [Endozoicomonas sp. YOMI1]|uniref:hypothetical protein n=1 Tax=Endozoicomonas sp. YOMI1 TaxID=2828739 RepID=UPI0021483080